MGAEGPVRPSPSLCSECLGVVSEGWEASRPGHLLPHLPLLSRRDQSAEGGRPPGLPEGSLESPGARCSVWAACPQQKPGVWGLGRSRPPWQGAEEASRHRGLGQVPTSCRTPYLATGSALSGEPRGRAPARLRKVQQEQESEAERGGKRQCGSPEGRQTRPRGGRAQPQTGPAHRAGGPGRGQARGCHSPQVLPSLLSTVTASWQLAGVAQAPWTLSLC